MIDSKLGILSEHSLDTVDGVPGSGYLQAGDHEIFYETWGNPDGKPVMHLHGGPGAGYNESHATLYDPNEHFVVFHDQRGAGNSTNTGEAYALETNTTPHLVDDISRLADRFGMDEFNLSGGSWGSTLSMIYAIQNPERVKDMVLWGVTRVSSDDMNLSINERSRNFAGGSFDRLARATPSGEIDDYREMAAHLLRTVSEGGIAGRSAATAYGLYQGKLSQPIDPMNEGTAKRYEFINNPLIDKLPTIAIYGLFKLANRTGEDLLRQAAVPLHYFSNLAFVGDNYIRDNVDALKGKAIHIVSGAQDMNTHPEIGREVFDDLGGESGAATFNLVEAAGHLRDDRKMNDAIKRATSKLAA